MRIGLPSPRAFDNFGDCSIGKLTKRISRRLRLPIERLRLNDFSVNDVIQFLPKLLSKTVDVIVDLIERTTESLLRALKE
jgi:hypothetical protein